MGLKHYETSKLMERRDIQTSTRATLLEEFKYRALVELVQHIVPFLKEGKPIDLHFTLSVMKPTDPEIKRTAEEVMFVDVSVSGKGVPE